ncbi:MAG: hypothetical protein ACO4BY_11945, partial [Candidatus Nanopelagicales bacterium]
HGAHIRTWRNEEGLPFPGECPWETDQRDAEAVARTLGIPFRSVDLIDAYRATVVDDLVEGGAPRRPAPRISGGRWRSDAAHHSLPPAPGRAEPDTGVG